MSLVGATTPAARSKKAWRWLKRVGFSLLTLLTLSLVYGVVFERFFVLQTGPPVQVSIPALPTSWQGKRLGVIADIHAGMWLGKPKHGAPRRGEAR